MSTNPHAWNYSPGKPDRWGPNRGAEARTTRADEAGAAELQRRDRHDRRVAFDWAFGPTVEQRAARLGAEHGRAAGSWALDGNSSAETARAILRGIEEGDPEVLDRLPIVPDLTGEWADSPTGPGIYAEITGVDWPETGDDFSDVLDIYEQAFTDAAVAEIERSARAMVED